MKQLKNGNMTFAVKEDIYDILRDCVQDNKRIWNVLMVGPSGSGKTTLPILIANELKTKILKMDCGTVRDPEEWFGIRGAANGSTFFEQSPLVKIITDGGCVILDEINRVQPYILSTLYGMLDDTRQVTIHGEEVHVHPETTFIATINQGIQYSGTFRLDEALRQRFDIFLNMTFPTKAAEQEVFFSITKSEETAKKIVDILAVLRAWNAAQKGTLDVSTRTGVKIAKLINAFGITIDRAIKLTILNSVLDDSVRKDVVDVVKSMNC